MISPIYRPLFDIKSWIKLLKAFGGAAFYITIILLVLSYFNRKLFKKEVPLRLLAVVLLFSLILQFIVFFSVPYEKRYLCFFTFMLVILSVPGVPKLAELIQKLSKYWPWLTPQKSFIAVIVLITVLSAGKALAPSGDTKKWMREIPAVIEKHCPPGQIPLLVTNSSDERVAYYSKADYIKLSFGDENVRFKNVNGIVSEIFPLEKRSSVGVLATRGVNDFYGAWVTLDVPQGLEYFSDNIRNFGGDRVFVLVSMDNKDFSDYFEEKGIPFPSMKFVKEFNYTKGRKGEKMIFTLYQGLSVNAQEENKN